MKESNFHSMIQVNQTTQTKENTMNELSNLHNSDNHNRTMSSREIAELTGKLHKNVLADIRQIIETLSGTKEINRLKFQPVEYTDAKGEKRPAYKLNFDATMTLLVGYGMTYNAAKESLSKRGFKEKAVMENLPMNQSMNLGMNKTMSSREIAALTGKLHKNVIQDIRTLIEQGAIDRLNFQPISYKDSYGREQPEYLLDFDATMTLVTGYNAVLRAKVIRRWRELEEGTAQPAFQPRNLSNRELEAKDLEAKLGIFKTLCEAAKLFGLEGNQALLKADKSLKKDYGDSFITRLEIELKSPDNEALLIATEIGKRLNPPVSAKQVNLLLANMKLQEKVEYRAGKFEWRLTDRGKAYGSYLDTGKTHSNGTPIQQIKWKESILPLVQKHSDSL